MKNDHFYDKKMYFLFFKKHQLKEGQKKYYCFKHFFYFLFYFIFKIIDKNLSLHHPLYINNSLGNG
jgi:hypothetical protein